VFSALAGGFFFFFKSLFIILCGEPYGREYMSSENLSIKCAGGLLTGKVGLFLFF